MFFRANFIAYIKSSSGFRCIRSPFASAQQHFRGGSLDLAVKLGAQQNHQTGDIKPG